MDGNDLARWTRFAAKGGIGKCTALQDCVAQGADDLMFLKDDEVVVLLQLPQEDQYLGYCEGVVGRFHGSAVRFHGKLKKPVFAKRQSTVGSSPSRPISLSPRSPSTNSPNSANALNTKAHSSPASSPHVPSLSSTPSSDPKSSHPARLSMSSISPSSNRNRGPSHSRTASNASSSSHYSTHSRPPSRVPEPMPVNKHIRSASTASSAHARSGSDSGSEETQHVSLPARPPPAPPGTTTTPGLTAGSSAHSSFLLTPTPALSTFPSTSSKVPASLFQGRARSGSEKLSPREDTRDVRKRSGSENSVILPRRSGEEQLIAGAEGPIQELVVQSKAHVDVEELPTGASETSFQSVSVYSEASAAEPDDLAGAVVTKAARLSVMKDRGILREDESEGEASREDGRAASVSGLSDLSDGGFGIGMTLLREDDDEDSEYEETDDQEDEETAIGHATTISNKEIDEVDHSPRTPRTPGMRVMNPSNESPSTSESEGSNEDPKDDTVMPQFESVSMFASTSTATEFPASTSSETAVSNLPPVRPSMPTHVSSSSIASGRTSSSMPTEDEHWESDADIYDDYRYSRYSSHSPGQHSSRRASRASSKSARSRASVRPPLPDEESWRRGTEESTPPRKSMTSQRSGSTSTNTGLEPKLGGPSATTLNHPSSLNRDPEISTDKPGSRDLLAHGQWPTPPQSLPTEMIVPSTPGAASIASVTSPLTRAFRQSGVSVYSEQSDDDEDEETLEDNVLTIEKSSVSHPPEPERKRTEDERSRSPALASSLREKIQNELRSKSPTNLSIFSAAPPQLSVLTARSEDEPTVIVLNESPVSNESPSSTSPDGKHLRVASPQSYIGSSPPSPLNPSYPPSPASMASFATTAPLTINKSPSPSPSPSTPRHPISPPAIPFAGVPPPGRPPTHMQYYAQQQPYHSQFTPPNQHPPGQGNVPPSESLHSALRMAGQQRANTIHGHVQTDLLAATGPVPISFLLPGMLPPLLAQARPQPAALQPPYGHLPPPTQNRTESPILEMRSQPTSPLTHNVALGQSHPNSHPLAVVRPPGQRPMTAPAPAPGAKSFLTVDLPSPSPPPSPDAYRTKHAKSMKPDARPTEMPPTSPSAPLPRANFFPKVGKARPRSRSFSGFNSEITEKISQSLGKRSQEEGNQPFVASNSVSRPGSSLSSKTPTQTLAPSPVMGPTRGKPAPAARPAHGPSPLSLPPTTSNSPSSSLAAHGLVPPSPISGAAPSSVRSLDIQDSHGKGSTLHQTPSYVSLRQTQVTISAPTSVTFPQRRNSGPSGSHLIYGDDSSSLRPPSPLKSPTTRQSHESDRTHTSFSRSDMSTPPPMANGSSSSSSPLARSGSLRSKISISAMRAKGGPRNIREGASETASSTNGPATPTDEETVQIKDMEFELVRPAIMRGSSDLHRNEDSSDHKQGMSVRTTDLNQDSSSVRSEALSPGGMSLSDGRAAALNISLDAFPSTRKGKVVETNNSVQAHRDRELKWISTMNSGDAAQARKSKKIKKLLIDGVPSSVRYLVWSHLSDSASKKMPQIYAQLSKRRPTFARDIERDVELSFPDHQHLRDPNGPLVSVLYAYIAMVPDLRYHRGLAIIAGNLLLQSPEEDAFWTFLAMMDSHLRPYFMPTSPQLAVDTALFLKTMEAADPQLSKRVFSELNVRPQDLCGVWFSSVFAGTLPLAHLHRVWDLFFYEGVPLLFRVGLTILSLSRRHLLESSKGSPTSYTAYLLCPPPDALPTDPEQFISQVLSVKLKDDDIRKTRSKMTDAALKQQRAPRISTPQTSHLHLSSQGERVRAS